MMIWASFVGVPKKALPIKALPKKAEVEDLNRLNQD